MEKLYSTKQVAEAWGVSPRTIQRYVMEGRLSHYKIGKNVKFSDTQLEEFLKENSF